MSNRDKRIKLLEKIKQGIPSLSTSHILMVNECEKPRKRRPKNYGMPEGYYDLTIIVSFSSNIAPTVHDALQTKNEGLCFPYGIEGCIHGNQSELCVVMNSKYIRNVRSLFNKVKIKKPGDWEFRLITLSMREGSNFLDD